MPRLKRDTEIHQDVRAELPLYEAGSPAIEITVHRGVVYLNGLVDSYAQKWAIGRAVTRIVGVKELRNYLHVRPPGTADRDDRRIERAANRALHWDAQVPEGIRAEVSNGVLRLNGAVERCWQREAAEEAVRNLIGLRDIVNEIALLPAAPPADLAFQIEAAIRRRFGLASEAISVAATQSLVMLYGVVPTLAVLGEIERVVWSIPGVNRVENHLLVA